MKPHRFPVLAVAILAAFATVHAAPVINWTERTGQTPVSDMDTASPTVGDGSTNSAKARSIWATMPTVTLANVGDKVTLSGSVTLSGITSSHNQFRFGLFNVNGSTDDIGWLGYTGSHGHNTVGANLSERPDPNTTWYMATPVTTTLTAAPNTEFTDATYNFLLSLERVGGGLQINSSIIRTSDSTQFGLHNFLDPTVSTATFDRVAFLIGTAINADQVQFSDIDVTFTALLEITSFAAVEDDLWQVALKGAPGVTCEFRSSAVLDFSPGTLVENLTKGDPGDPGTIIGPNDSRVTTDGSGNALVRMALPAGPAAFVRGQTVP